MNANLQQMMRDTLTLTRSGQMKEATATIQRFLRDRGAPAGLHIVPTNHGAGDVIDVDAVVLDEERPPLVEQEFAEPMPVQPDVMREAPAAEPTLPKRPAFPNPAPGSFISGQHSEAGLTRDYKLFIPPQGGETQSLPLLVMLHGCTQNPDDFAAGTAMNELALEQGFYVLYPAQAGDANPQRCWNWFKRSHQQRGRGEPAVLAGMTRAAIAAHNIDPQRVYVAGLSAGGAMAAILAVTYPDLFAAAGVHSGLTAGAARDVMGALAAMKDGAPRAANAPLTPASTVPTIVFHGDRDSTVNPINGEQVLMASLAGASTVAQRDEGVSARGRGYTRTCHRAPDGRSVAEHWRIHGAGHAWSGGHAKGSYTDPSGPDASREMLRFFLQQPLRQAAV